MSIFKRIIGIMKRNRKIEKQSAIAELVKENKEIVDVVKESMNDSISRPQPKESEDPPQSPESRPAKFSMKD